MKTVIFWIWGVGAGITFILTAPGNTFDAVFGSGEWPDTFTYSLFWPLFAIKYLFMGIGFLAINLIDLLF